MKAHLHVWRSKLTERYAKGHLIAVATDADQAREEIRSGYAAWLAEHKWWLDDEEELAELKATLESDLAADPKVMTHLYGSGSE